MERKKYEKLEAEKIDFYNLIATIGQKEYGLHISYLDNETVHIRDRKNKEVSFSFPTGIDLDSYDAFVEEMQDKNKPPPSIERVIVVVRKSLMDLEKRRGNVEDQNFLGKNVGVKALAREHNVPVQEMISMLALAKLTLYRIYKERLRGSKQEETS